MKWLRYIIYLLFFVTITGANPYSAWYNPEPDRLFWFLSFTDTHIGPKLEGGNQPVDNLNWATSELLETVAPEFTVHTGDITDGKGEGLIPTGQVDAEWQTYRAIVDSNNITTEGYYDLPGNHDQYSDGDLSHYLEYSIQGQATGAINHAWTRVDESGKYLFVALATCGSDGAPWPMDNGGLDAADIQFLQSTLAAHQDSDIIVFFGHHPAQASYYWNNGLELFQTIVEQWDVSAYIFGHSHNYSMQWKWGALHINIASLGKSAHHQVGLYAFDGRGLSATVFDAGQWPQVLVTAPLDSALAGAHLHDYMIPASMEGAPIRAIAFHPDGVAQVTASIDNGPAFDLEKQDDHVWQGTFDPAPLDEYPHTLTVVAYAGGKTDVHSLTFYVLPEPTPPEAPPETQGGAEAVEPWPDVVEQSDALQPDWETVEEATSDSDLGTPAPPDAPAWDLTPRPEQQGSDLATEEVEPPSSDQGSVATGYIHKDSGGCSHGLAPHSAGRAGLSCLAALALLILLGRRLSRGRNR